MLHRLLHSDALGISASVACLIHCMAVPIAAAFAPLLLTEVLDAPWFHIVLIFVIGPVAGWALWQGYRDHRQTVVVYWGLAGLSLIIAGSLTPVLLTDAYLIAELTVMALGSLLLIAVHLYNYRLRLQSGHHRH